MSFFRHCLKNMVIKDKLHCPRFVFYARFFGIALFLFFRGSFMSKEFGDHLRAIRKGNGYSQQQIADILNISRSTYTYYETGKSEPSQEKLKKFCEIFNVDYNTLFDCE